MLQQIKPKPVSDAWSYSRLKNFEVCARRYAEIEVKKSVSEGKNPEMERGNDLHEAMCSRVMSDKPLPASFIYMEPWAKKFTNVLSPYQIIQCELKLAVTKEGTPCGFFANNVWLRGRIDYFRCMPSGKGYDIGHVVDYKTGKPKDDWTQLMLSAHLIFQHYAAVQELRTDFLWTEYNDSSHENFKRSDMPQAMAGMTPRVNALTEAHRTGVFNPTPNGLCAQYCPVTTCEFHGKRRQR